MKYVFIVNPKSGQNELKEDLMAYLESNKEKLDYEIYFTKGEKDATRFVEKYCSCYKDEVVFFACGGDGTLNEVVSGAINYSNAIVSCYPCGSGNDFVKVYGGKEKFLNLDNLLSGVEVKIDVMKVNDKYAVNVTNFGFDAKACDIANKVRRKKIIGGKRSYTTGLIGALFTGRRNKCKVSVDGRVLEEKKVLLCTIANGKYIGGAYLCAPYSLNDDGLLEINIIKPISILKFISLVPVYKKGEHLNNSKLEKIIKYCKGKKVVVEASKIFKICLDGEIYEGKHFEIENMPKKLRFIKPKE